MYICTFFCWRKQEKSIWHIFDISLSFIRIDKVSLEIDISLWEIYFRLGAQNQGTLGFNIRAKPYMPWASFESFLSHNSVSSREPSFSSCFLSTHFLVFPTWGLNATPSQMHLNSVSSVSFRWVGRSLISKEIIFPPTFLSDSFPPFWDSFNL